MTLRFKRYVAIGDSSTEGLQDPDGAGGYRGWADRLAERVAQAQGGLLYANLGVRGKRSRDIREEQLGSALAMKPDLATVFAGSNDILERHFDAGKLRAELRCMMAALAGGKAVVLTFTLPDLTGVMPIGRFLAPRVRAMNESIREAAAATGARLIDFAAYSAGSDPRLWSEDRFHVNAEGHARIAAALAQALGLPGRMMPGSSRCRSGTHGAGGLAWPNPGRGIGTTCWSTFGRAAPSKGNATQNVPDWRR
jgi:lysophospholipase L1-like esterase